ELNKAGSNGVVVTGLQDVNAQMVVLEINEQLKSKAFDTENVIKTRQGNDATVQSFINDMKAGKVGAVIMSGVNPMYTLPNASDFATGIKKVKLSVNFTSKEDETAAISQYIAAAPHYLESWGDVEIKKGHFALMQPTIRPLFDTKQFQESLLKWTSNDVTLNDYIKTTWKETILNGASFNQALHDGVFVTKSNVVVEETATLEEETVEIPSSNAASDLASSASSKGVELTLYTKTGMGDGQQANNPWLQEFPDPISRASWDNYVTVSKADAAAWALVNNHDATGALNGSYVNLKVGNKTLKNVPVIIQPGQAKGTVGLSLGYGRTTGLKDEMKTGVNAYELYADFNTVQTVTVEKASGMHEFACLQLQNTLMGRGDIIKETTLEVFNTKDKKHWNAVPVVSLNHQETEVTSPEVDLWDEFDRSIGHHFNLSIDLNACTGCGACVIACHAENNVPVVGKEEIRRSRDMHWLRIDRYYSSEETFAEDDAKKDGFTGLFGDEGSLGGFGELEDPSVNPQVAFQPVMCQHCNHAPCETVCPVAATAHGKQGQNHMAYNRCVGTRYCANNCPYKVRRFNWFLYAGNDEFDYHLNDDLGRMVVNPDVTVRSRGVMEKCSMCIQKTQKTILDAKRDGREIKDGEFQTACSAACSNGAMLFGDINDKDSKVAKLTEDDRMYHLLESVGTKPNVMYHTKVRNIK
ncbi:4Fe-4S dicluster domain-containing protein, partial [Aurantibacter sp.]|uniref:4Fe-4S dicluster domain-containing protein n=1 Tax=Aurantibacter sp. TaxID=2807103 RepID=UPI0035C7E8CF